jgi:hypothetical protein
LYIPWTDAFSSTWFHSWYRNKQGIIQRREINWGRWFMKLSREDNLKDIKMFNLEKETLRRFIISILKYLKEGLCQGKRIIRHLV